MLFRSNSITNLPFFIMSQFSNGFSQLPFTDGQNPISDGINAMSGLFGQSPLGNIDSNRLPQKELGLQVKDVLDRKSTRLNSSHIPLPRMPSSA